MAPFRCSRVLATLAATVAVTGAFAQPPEVPQAVRTAASAAEKGLKKAEEAVVRAAQVAASSVEYGAGKAGEAVQNTAQRLGLPAGAAPAPARSMAEAKR